MDALAVLKSRRSHRSFTDKPVPREIVEDLVDCGRLAPTARNLQPWEFVVVTDQETRTKLAQICDYGRFIKESPVCLVIFCRDTAYYLEDGSAATTNVLLAAEAHGLGACWVAGDRKPYSASIAKLLGAPETHKLISLIAVGYSDDQLSPAKRALTEVIHREKW